MAAGSADDQPTASGTNDATDVSETGRAAIQQPKHAHCLRCLSLI